MPSWQGQHLTWRKTNQTSHTSRASQSARQQVCCFCQLLTSEIWRASDCKFILLFLHQKCSYICVYACRQSYAHTRAHAHDRRLKGYLQTETNQCMWDKKTAFMVYGNHPQPATNMHNHHDLFTWLMKYASVKSNLLLLSPLFSPLPQSFPFSQSFFVLFNLSVS